MRSNVAPARGIAEKKRDESAERQRAGKEEKAALERAGRLLHHAHDRWPGKAAEIAGCVDERKPRRGPCAGQDRGGSDQKVPMAA
jgi:hypothetical protein